jgi:hypothetical protein
MNPLVIALIVLVIILLVLRFKSSYTKPVYTPNMSIEEVTAEYLKATKEMSEEHLTNLETATDEAQKAILIKKFESDGDEMAKEMRKITEDLHQKRPDTCPPCPACGVKDIDAAKPSKSTTTAAPIKISKKEEDEPKAERVDKTRKEPKAERVAPEPQTAEVTGVKTLAPV